MSKKKRVLFVDHEDSAFAEAQRALGAVGLEAVHARDRRAAVESFRKFETAAILVRVDLGREDGRDVCTAIRSRPDGSLVPILFFGRAQAGDSVRSTSEALSAGADYFFRAPLDYDDLARRVQSWTAGESIPLPDVSLDLLLQQGTGEAETDMITPEAPRGSIASVAQLRANVVEGHPLWHEAKETSTSDRTTPGFLAGHQINVRIPDVITEVAPGEEQGLPEFAMAGPDVEALVREARSLTIRGEKSSAVDAYEAAAALCEVGNSPKQAVTIYRTILQIEPSRSDIANRAAQLSLTLGQPEEAIAIYQRATDALEDQGDLFDASELVRKMIAIQPEDAALRARADALEERLMRATGEIDLRKLQKLDPDMPRSLSAVVKKLAQAEEDDTGADRPALNIPEAETEGDPRLQLSVVTGERHLPFDAEIDTIGDPDAGASAASFAPTKEAPKDVLGQDAVIDVLGRVAEDLSTRPVESLSGTDALDDAIREAALAAEAIDPEALEIDAIGASDIMRVLVANELKPATGALEKAGSSDMHAPMFAGEAMRDLSIERRVMDEAIQDAARSVDEVPLDPELVSSASREPSAVGRHEISSGAFEAIEAIEAEDEPEVITGAFEVDALRKEIEAEAKANAPTLGGNDDAMIDEAALREAIEKAASAAAERAAPEIEADEVDESIAIDEAIARAAVADAEARAAVDGEALLEESLAELAVAHEAASVETRDLVPQAEPAPTAVIIPLAAVADASEDSDEDEPIDEEAIAKAIEKAASDAEKAKRAKQRRPHSASRGATRARPRHMTPAGKPRVPSGKTDPAKDAEDDEPSDEATLRAFRVDDSIQRDLLELERSIIEESEELAAQAPPDEPIEELDAMDPPTLHDVMLAGLPGARAPIFGVAEALRGEGDGRVPEPEGELEADPEADLEADLEADPEADLEADREALARAPTGRRASDEHRAPPRERSLAPPSVVIDRDPLALPPVLSVRDRRRSAVLEGAAPLPPGFASATPEALTEFADSEWPDPPLAPTLIPSFVASFIGAPARPHTLRPAASLGETEVPFVPFTPDRGSISNLLGALKVLVEVRARRATGIIELDTGTRLVFAGGEPLAVRGARAGQGLVGLLLRSGRVPPPVLQDLLAADLPDRPVDLGRNLVARTLLRDAECIVLLERQLEDAISTFLRHRGPWSFTPANPPIDRDELVPATCELRDRLADLLPRTVALHELHAALGGSRAIIRVAPGYASIARSGDHRLLALLDGRYSLDEAIDLAAVPSDRAAALALVFVAFGLATVIERYGIRATANERPPPPPETVAPPPKRPPPPQRATSRPSTRAPSVPAKPVPLPDPAKDLAVPGIPAATTATDPTPPGSATGKRVDQLEALEPEKRLRALADVVRTSDYFTILDLDRNATNVEISAAHKALRRLIRVEDFQRIEHIALARDVLRSIDEARDVLSVPALRAAYQQHLKPPT